ncbi:MAG: hypothetical protein ACLQIB_34935 [Isosphaeraceae bacterium]
MQQQQMIRQQMLYEQQMMREQLLYERQMMQQMQRQVPGSRQRQGGMQHQTHQAKSALTPQQRRNAMKPSSRGNLRKPSPAQPANRFVVPNNLLRPGNVNQPWRLAPTPFGLFGVTALPPFSYPFQQPMGQVGQSTFRAVNSTENDAQFELRAQPGGAKGSFRVPAGGSNEVAVPSGSYQVFFRFSNEPEAIYQGEDIRLSNPGGEFRLGGIANGNYTYRRVN